MLNVGQIINDTYEIKERIGSGGGGIIFRAYHSRMKKDVALKLIKDNVKGIIENRSEVDILKNLKNDYLPQVLDFVETDGDVYTVMEFIEGNDFKQLIRAGRTFTEKEVRKYAVQLCEAVKYLHSQEPPIIHSDIKPANIMLTPKDNICLIDFNISAISSGKDGAYSVGGSKGFAAPEQFRKIVDVPVTVDEFHEETRFIGDDNDETEFMGDSPSVSEAPSTMKTKNISMAYIDIRTDIYGMGASLYYMITGRVPANGKTDFRGIKISSGLKHIITKAMNPNPEKRYRNAAEMLDAIRGSSSSWGAAAAVAVTAVLVAAVCVVGSFMNFGADKAEPLSEEPVTEEVSETVSKTVPETEKPVVTTVTTTVPTTETTPETTKLVVSDSLKKEWADKLGTFMFNNIEGEYNSFLGISGEISLDDYTFDDIPEIAVTFHSMNGWTDNAVFDIDGNLIYRFVTGFDEEGYVYVDTETNENLLMFKGTAGSAGSSADYQVCFNNKTTFFAFYTFGEFDRAEINETLKNGEVKTTTVNTIEESAELREEYFGGYFRSSVYTFSNVRWNLKDNSTELSEAYFDSIASDLVNKYVVYLHTGVPAAVDEESVETSVSETTPASTTPAASSSVTTVFPKITMTQTASTAKQTTTAAAEAESEVGWQHDSGGYYFITSDGLVLTGHQIINDDDYYFDDDGYALTGWTDVGFRTVYLSEKGCVQLGWLELGKKTYYLGVDGDKRTGWHEIDGSVYYFSSDGTMVTGKQTIDRESYIFSNMGKLTSGNAPDIVTFEYTDNWYAKWIKEMKTYDKASDELEDMYHNGDMNYFTYLYFWSKLQKMIF